jgi:hypothetical protein
MKRIVLLTFIGSLALALTGWGSSEGKTRQPRSKEQERACRVNQVRWSCCEGTHIAERAAAGQNSFGHPSKQDWKKPHGSGKNPQRADG